MFFPPRQTHSVQPHTAQAHTAQAQRKATVALAVFAILSSVFCAATGFALVAPEAISIKEVKVRDFAPPPPPTVTQTAITPSVADAKFPLGKAVNLKQVEKRVGKLNPAQRKFLEENRFLLLPSKERYPFLQNGHFFDEMLGSFDGIANGGEQGIHDPGNALFVGPDPFLQALHKYFSVKLKYLEETHLSHALYTLTRELYANAVALRAKAGPEAAPHWERFQAQMVVPLILMRACRSPGGSFGEDPGFDPDVIAATKPMYDEDEKKEPLPEPPDSLKNVLALFDEYKAAFSPETASAVTAELKKIVAFEAMEESALGMVSHPREAKVDYTQFRPRSHYESNSILRAYFRTMIWMGQLGWRLETDTGRADAANFMLAMSYENPDRPATPPAAAAPAKENDADQDNVDAELAPRPLTRMQAWQEIMELTSFFVGYPDEPSYADWSAWLSANAASLTLTPDSAVDPQFQALLLKGRDSVKPAIKHFAALQNPMPSSLLRVLPQRFTVSWLIGDKLSYKRGSEETEKLPVAFSGLWVPATFGSVYARELLEKQVELCVKGNLSADADGGPLPEGKTSSPPLPEESAREVLNRQKAAVPALNKAMETLAEALGKEPEIGWFSSVGASWLHLLRTLTADYGKGYPLYMQSPAFRAKQLESFMGSWTELKHDTLLYEKPNYAEMGDGEEEVTLPVPKGFVEPNLAFWRELLRVTEYIRSGFAGYGIFKGDLEEDGSLERFRRQLLLCIRLSEKELGGQAISAEEYEELRTDMALSHMADLKGGLNVVDPELFKSALIVDVQTNRQFGYLPWGGIVYNALAEPRIMLVLVGNDKTPRVTIGMAFDHREFMAPHGPRLTDSIWKARIYGQGEEPPRQLPLPEKNFWYKSLLP